MTVASVRNLERSASRAMKPGRAAGWLSTVVLVCSRSSTVLDTTVRRTTVVDVEMRHVVVVGAGLAGSQAVAALREQGFTGRVTVIGAEQLAPYDRPPLSKELFTRAEPAWLHDELGTSLDAADDVRLGVSATGLDLGSHGVTVHVAGDGSPLAADGVVLASGAHAVNPWPAALTLHTAADAEALRARLRPGARLVVVGAGWIGAEVAGVAARAGVDVTVVEAAAAPLAAALGADVGARTAPWYATAGARLLTGTTVVDVAEDEVRVVGPDGPRSLPADVVLAAVGARPSTAWLRGSLPLGPDGAVEVDAHHRVLGPRGPVARLVAVGDVARRRSARFGAVAGGHWDAALRLPAEAVRTLLATAGGPTWAPADPAPYVFSTQLGHELSLFGQPGPDDEVLLRAHSSSGAAAEGWTMLWLGPQDALTAALVVDRPADVGGARRLMASADPVRVDRAKASDPDQPLRRTTLD